MPLGKKFRSSSASGRLETKHVISILSEQRDAGVRTRDTTGPEKAPWRVGVGEEQPEWLVRELLKQNRRHSVTLGDKAQITRSRRRIIYSSQSFEFDEKMSLDDFKKLKILFEESEMRGSGCIDVRDFGNVLRKSLGLPNVSKAQIHGLFKKIDYLDQGKISWEEFSTYMLQEYKEKENIVRRNEQVAFTLPAITNAYAHGIPNVNIHFTHDGAMSEGPAHRKSKWVTDFTLIMEYHKLMIGTGDREIQIYELFSLEPYCQISALTTIPLTLDCSYTDPDRCCVLYGDAEGCVTIILISSARDTLRLWNTFPKIENMPNIAIGNAALSPNVTFVRWKVHHDWVTQAKYFPTFQAVVSSSSEESSSLVIGCVLPLTDTAQQLNEIKEVCYENKSKTAPLSWTPRVRASRDQTVFTIYKGVKTFDLCEKHSLLVTGGVDRLIRLWNPHFSGKPTGILRGHSTPIFSLCVSSEDSRIFSVSTDATVKIWHIQYQYCLFTADPKASKIYGDLSACAYSPTMKSLYIAADCMAVLPVKLRPRLHSRFTVSHNEPVMCCGYSEEFRQVVSCSEGAVVKVWDFDTGRQVLEFDGRQDLTSITCMTFDSKGRRLITGGRDGCLKIWNFNNGQCLKTLKNDAKCREVLDCIFLKVHRNFSVMSVGRDRRIDIYSDNVEDLHHVQRPQASWQDDLINGHKGDILCVTHCPPSFVATSSHDGEIIVWNVISGRIYCRFVESLEAEHQNVKGLDKSVPTIIFLKNLKMQQFSSTITLLSSGSRGCVNLWNVLSGGKPVSSFKASKFQQKVIKLAKADKDKLLYTADRIGYVYVYNIEKFDPKKKSPPAETFWRAHTSTITSLQVVDSDQVVLTSSIDHTVRLWSAQGEFIGTFGQPDIWSVHFPSSWMHPNVPFEVLVDPLSMPDDDTLYEKSHLSEAINPDKTEADRGELKSL